MSRRIATKLSRSISVDCTPDEAYEYWCEIRNLPLILPNVSAIEDLGDGFTRWRIRGAGGMKVDWDTQIACDGVNRIITWNSTNSAESLNTGAVRFVPAARGSGTAIHVEMRYDSPRTFLGVLSNIFGPDINQQIRRGLKNFRTLVASGDLRHAKRRVA